MTDTVQERKLGPYELMDGEVQTPKQFDPKLNRIVCAANQLPDGRIILGVRHWDGHMHKTAAIMDLPEQMDREVQGFVDKFGNFHTREQAWIIAFNAGQIIRRCGADNGKLFSENLY